MPEGTLRLALDVPPGHCGICRAEPGLAGQLVLNIGDEDGMIEVVACRPCLSEYAPDLLALLEGEAPDAFSLGGPS